MVEDVEVALGEGRKQQELDVLELLFPPLQLLQRFLHEHQIPARGQTQQSDLFVAVLLHNFKIIGIVQVFQC